MELINYASDNQALKDYGYKFEHLALPCTILFKQPNGEFLPLGLTISLGHQIELRMPLLARGTCYTLQDICGENYWRNLTKVQQVVASMCVTHLIEQEHLPLIPVKSTNANLEQYQVV